MFSEMKTGILEIDFNFESFPVLDNVCHFDNCFSLKIGLIEFFCKSVSVISVINEKKNQTKTAN